MTTTAVEVETGRSDRRSALLAAAVAGFDENGYEATTLDDVLRRSGASVGSLYHHFGGKEGLAAAVYLEGIGRYQDRFRDCLARHPGAERGVRAIVRNEFAWTLAEPALARFVIAPRGRTLPAASRQELNDLNRSFFAEVAAWLARHVEDGRIRALPTELYYPLWIGPSHLLARQILNGRIEAPGERAERELARAAWASLRADGKGMVG
jgi:AcrR family transcriptional regulator